MICMGEERWGEWMHRKVELIGNPPGLMREPPGPIVESPGLIGELLGP